MKKSTLDLTTIGLFVLGLYYFFSPTLTSIHTHWSQVSANYSHGYLLLLVGMYLFYEARKHSSAPNTYRYWQLFAVPLIGSSLIWLIADVVRIQIIQQLSILAISYFFLGMIYGIQGAKDALFPVGIIVLAIPIWSSIIEILQHFTVVVCTFGLSLLNIPAHIHQFNIEIPDGVIHVADSCSGLNYFLIAVSLGAIQAQLSYRSLKPKLILTLFAAITGLASNWIRVFSLIVIGHVTKMQSPLMENHFWHGWIIFGVSLIPIFALSRILKDSPTEPPPASLDNEQPGSALTRPSIAICSFSLLFAFAGPLALGFAPKTNTAIHINEMVEDLLAWNFKTTNQTDWSPRYFGADKVITGTLENSSQRAELNIYLYFSQAQGKELIYYRNSIANKQWQQVKTHTSTFADTRIITSTLVNKESKQAKALIYWYQVGDASSNNENTVKALQLKNFLQGRSDVALVALSSDCFESCESAFKFLDQLVSPVKSAYITLVGTEDARVGSHHPITPTSDKLAALNIAPR